MTDHAAFLDFYAQTERLFWAYLLRLCESADAARDLMQESYLRLLQKPPKSAEFAARKAYLYSIATHLHLDAIRQLHRRAAKLLEWFTEKNEEAVFHQTAPELSVDMESIFAQLSPRDRALLWLAYVEELPHCEVSEILGVKESSVKVMAFRARRRLLDLLKLHDYSGENV